jgi:hypothetical protein
MVEELNGFQGLFRGQDEKIWSNRLGKVTNCW